MSPQNSPYIYHILFCSGDANDTIIQLNVSKSAGQLQSADWTFMKTAANISMTFNMSLSKTWSCSFIQRIGRCQNEIYFQHFWRWQQVRSPIAKISTSYRKPTLNIANYRHKIDWLAWFLVNNLDKYDIHCVANAKVWMYNQKQGITSVQFYGLFWMFSMVQISQYKYTVQRVSKTDLEWKLWLANTHAFAVSLTDNDENTQICLWIRALL